MKKQILGIQAIPDQPCDIEITFKKETTGYIYQLFELVRQNITSFTNESDRLALGTIAHSGDWKEMDKPTIILILKNKNNLDFFKSKMKPGLKNIRTIN